VRAGASDLAALFTPHPATQPVAAVAAPGYNQHAGTYQQTTARAFKIPMALTRFVQGLLALSLLTTLAGIGFELWTMSLVFEASSVEAMQENAPISYAVAALCNVGMSILIFILTVVFWCIWVHRVSSNAHSLGAQGMTFSPGWAVGYYFIPFLCLWKPYQTMAKIWKASDWRSRDLGAVVHLWWTFAILSSIAAQAYFTASAGAEDLPGMLTSGWVGVGSGVLDIIFHITAFWMVGRVCTVQLRHVSSKN